MISRFEAYMDGIALSSVHPNIYITNIGHSVSNQSINANTRANLDGAIIQKIRRESTQISIAFLLRVYDISERQIAMQMVQQWANGSIMETYDRPGQRLFVTCTEPPVIGNALEWAEEIEMTFTAHARPFWEEKTPATLSLTGTSNTGTLYVPGNAGDALVEVTITPSNLAQNFTVTVGGQTITLTGATASSASPVRIYYDERNIQHITGANNVSYMNKRTGADDLIAACGAVNNFAMTADAATTVTFSVRGVWL